MDSQDQPNPALVRTRADEDEVPVFGGPFCGAVAGQLPHEQAQIEAYYMRQVALRDVLPAAQPRLAPAVPVQGVLEAAFGQLGAPADPLPAFARA